MTLLIRKTNKIRKSDEDALSLESVRGVSSDFHVKEQHFTFPRLKVSNHLILIILLLHYFL